MVQGQALSGLFWKLCYCALLSTMGGRLSAVQLPDTPPQGISQEEYTRLRDTLQSVERDLLPLREKSPKNENRWSDAEMFLKAVQWALRYEPSLTPDDRKQIDHALKRAKQREEALKAGKPVWGQKHGSLTRAYLSQVDSSLQPYGLIIPDSYTPQRPMRLDVVLHGSTRPVGMSELRFLSSFDEGDEKGRSVTNRDYIELHPLGRVENCYRWAGESDVFEAIEDVCRCYNIDRNRIVLRGMSMGASGTWHLGLKHPDLFVALGPYCGYVDTHQFSETPGMNFLRVGALPEYQERGLHMLDSVDYAANAGVVPAIAAIGEIDPFFQAHVIMRKAMQREGLEMVNLISPGTAHVQDPKTFAEQMRRIAVYADKGRSPLPGKLRFVTWTLKYARCYWLELEGLGEHYKRAEIQGTFSATDKTLRLEEPQNITRFALLSPLITAPLQHLYIAGAEIPLPASLPKRLVLEHKGERWQITRSSLPKTAKQPGLQGPLDDAFTTPFLCVRGTGKPWSPKVQEWADANLRRFAYEWSRYFRGDLIIKDDTAVTSEDCQHYNLILFGDAGSNLWIKKSLSKLPFKATQEGWQVGSQKFSSKEYAVALLCPSPFTKKGVSPRYLVINSGHTFHEAELNRLNYLLYPHQGDWAVFRVQGGQPQNPSEPLKEELIQSGYFGENWR